MADANKCVGHCFVIISKSGGLIGLIRTPYQRLIYWARVTEAYLDGVADNETEANKRLLVVVVQAGLNSVVDVLGHVLAVPGPVNSPGAGQAVVDRASGSHQARAANVRGEVDGLVQLVLVGATEHQTTAGVEVLDVVGWGGRSGLEIGF